MRKTSRTRAIRRSSWTVTRYDSLDEMKADEYRHWHSRPAHERFAMISELAREAYGEDAGDAHVPRLQRPLVVLERK